MALAKVLFQYDDINKENAAVYAFWNTTLGKHFREDKVDITELATKGNQFFETNDFKCSQSAVYRYFCYQLHEMLTNGFCFELGKEYHISF